MKYKKILIVILSLILFFSLIYLIIFGRALKQQEDHIGILLALPKVILSSKAVEIDNKMYLAKKSSSFINEMQQQGFSYIEQLGAGYVFQKNGEKYISTSRMYSSYFRVFTQPIKID